MKSSLATLAPRLGFATAYVFALVSPDHCSLCLYPRIRHRPRIRRRRSCFRLYGRYCCAPILPYRIAGLW